MQTLKKIICIIIMMFFFNTGNAKYEKVFFDFEIKNINEQNYDLASLKDKTILLVNVASNCGFTKQYAELQELYLKYMDKGLVVIGVPSNQFGGQEPGKNSEIKDFCESNFNISFPMTAKIDVIGKNAHPIYLWAKNNHGNSAVPKWNFHKILINKKGEIEDTFASFTNPMSKKLIKKLEEIL